MPTYYLGKNELFDSCFSRNVIEKMFLVLQRLFMHCRQSQSDIVFTTVFSLFLFLIKIQTIQKTVLTRVENFRLILFLLERFELEVD